MVLSQLVLSDFRNIKSCDISLSERCNVFYGDNGSGKTSLLEAVYLFWNSRSFRTARLSEIVAHQHNDFLIHGKVSDTESDFPFGLSYAGREKERIAKFNGEKVRRSSQLAAMLPVYYFSPQSDAILSGSPGNRRNLLFWYLFHVEPKFNENYQYLQKALSSRNKLLKAVVRQDELVFWEKEISRYSIELKRISENQVRDLHDQFKKECLLSDREQQGVELSLFDKLNGLDIHYPWKEDEDLESDLASKREMEFKLGYTTLGYHKCDLKIGTSQGKKSFSRGEEKSITLTLIISVLKIIASKTNKNILVLIDDLMAELDQKFTSMLIQKLSSLPLQLFITTLTKDSLLSTIEKQFSNFRLFHVKQGDVIEEYNV